MVGAVTLELAQLNSLSTGMVTLFALAVPEGVFTFSLGSIPSLPIGEVFVSALQCR